VIVRLALIVDKNIIDNIILLYTENFFKKKIIYIYIYGELKFGVGTWEGNFRSAFSLQRCSPDNITKKEKKMSLFDRKKIQRKGSLYIVFIIIIIYFFFFSLLSAFIC
jgi:hypothetical protein